MINAGALVTDLKAQLKALTTDLDAQAHDDELPWSKELRAEYEQAREHERTGLTWSAWLAGEVDQAAVAWLVAASFVRFCEDNRLIDGLWLAGPGDRLDRAVDNETAYYADNPTYNARDWLQQAFAALADLPAGRGLVDPEHNPVWRAPISADAAKTLVDLWRRRNDDRELVHDFTDPSLDTRFLGDLYQDLSEHARKTYALLQTPVFVEELIVTQTLEPAIREFGLSQLKVIDPTCGSGHFLLGAFETLYERWQTHDPDLEVRARAQRALDSLHGVDINPFAVAITRFRLTVAALKAIGERRLADAPHLNYHVAIGDSLLAAQGVQGDLLNQGDFEDAFEYANEDLGSFGDILKERQYHVVVGNPPYVTPKDKKANENYRGVYKTCYRQYALSVPFAELFFRLAKQADPTSGAGYVGQITANSFMKREFGTKLVDFLAGGDHFGTPVDLTAVYDTSGAYIPGHGTPTVILVGRRRSPQGDTVRAVLGIRGEPGQPDDPDKGLVWTEMIEHLQQPGFEGEFVSVVDLSRDVLTHHPWSLAGGAAPDVMDTVDTHSETTIAEYLDVKVGGAIRAGADEVYMRPRRPKAEEHLGDHLRGFVLGEAVRDYLVSGDEQIIFPYDVDGERLPPTMALDIVLWPWKSMLVTRGTFQGQMADAGLRWTEYMQFTPWAFGDHLSIAFAEVATHNHFVLDRGGKVFKQTAPVIKLPADASEGDHLDLLGVLNSSVACFWLKQVCHDKGNGGYGGGIADQEWERFYQLAATKVRQFPLPDTFPRERARALDRLAQNLAATSPSAVQVIELVEARERWHAIRRQMIAEQEELDWDVYRRYGLLDDDLTFDGDMPEVELGERAFEIALARRVRAGKENTEWFARHNSSPIAEIPDHWPADYRALVQRRLDLIESDRKIGLLERPEHKRRWATRGWQAEQDDALRETILDRLEDPGLWRDAHGPVTRSIAQLADLVRNDETIADALAALIGTPDVELTPALRELLDDQAVPAQAAYRYKPSGIVKFREWQQVWELQRREDRGETVDIAVPPKYKQADFLKPAYWRARGKLDVPKERFIAYPGTAQPGDPTPVLGWAGWNHAEQALALARMVTDNPGDESLLAGLAELEPWLHQWHAEVDPAFGTSPAQAITALLDQQLAVIGKTRDDLEAWRPAARTKRAKETT